MFDYGHISLELLSDCYAFIIVLFEQIAIEAAVHPLLVIFRSFIFRSNH